MDVSRHGTGRPRRATIDKEQDWLRSQKRPRARHNFHTVKAIDLFCGCGGMTVGLEEACRRSNLGLDVMLAIDNEPIACEVFSANFPSANVLAADASVLFDGEPGTPLTRTERRLKKLGPITIAYGGPPCQGHSDLNNHTRRRDPKNALYLVMARVAEVFKPDVLIVENVPTVLADSNSVVDAAKRFLEKSDYAVHGEVIDVSNLGVPQRRRRHILLASAVDVVDPIEVLSRVREAEHDMRDVRWAISDLRNSTSGADLDEPSQMSRENEKRARFLIDKNEFDLPNARRPPCHRDKEHSYVSMYGRLRWGEPAQTITTGFTSMGQGRYVHPSKPRTLTPHEAARLQTFPDWFDWSPASMRSALTRLIGNAVPPILMMRLAELLLPALVRVSNDGRT